jgi:dCMP deaminase
MTSQSFSWDQYFITMAYLVSMKSKDPSTRVGAVIVGQDNEIRSTGYNGLPRGVYDLPNRYNDRDYKYYACNHAEENAILHCARIGTSTMGCTLYTTWRPCSYCAKAIIQSGISTVVYHHEFPGNYENTTWGRSIEISHEILTEAKVDIRPYSGKLIEIKGMYNKNTFII